MPHLPTEVVEVDSKAHSMATDGAVDEFDNKAHSIVVVGVVVALVGYGRARSVVAGVDKTAAAD